MSLTISSGIPPHGPARDFDEGDNGTLIFWKIRCINSQTKLYFDRLLVIKTPDLPLAERQLLLSLTATSPSDPRILQHRQTFKEVSDEKLSSFNSLGMNFRNVWLDDYFEDENGKPLNMVGVVRILSGHDDPIILGNVGSVLRLGPAGIKQKEKWTAEKANNVAHFLRIVERIARSEWYRSPLSIEYALQTPDPGVTLQANELLNWKHPSTRATREILLPVRQLYSNDDAFNFACNAYLQHVDHAGKQFWVKERKSMFNETRSTEPFVFQIENHTTQEVLDLLIYGCGEVHRQSDDNTEERLKQALTKYGQPHIFVTFGFAVRGLIQYAFEVYPVIKQDFDHWIATEGIAGPDRVGLDELPS
jgi:hypothetical protein